MAAMTRPVVVWGNCQTAPIATLLRGPLASAGLEVAEVPPVFEVDEAGLERVRRLVGEAAVLVTQPIRDEYRIPGCGSEQLAALLPPDGRVVTIPSIYDLGPFPFCVNAHGGDGARVDAPRTVYHDLRLLMAAERGMGIDDVLGWLPGPTTADAYRANAEASTAELRRREAGLDVTVSEQLGAPGAMFTIDHPTNRVLAHVARGVLDLLAGPAAAGSGRPDAHGGSGRPGGADHADDVLIPERQFLGHTRVPVEPQVVEALGWPVAEAHPWTVEGEPYDTRTWISDHLALYAARPDIPADARTRFAARLGQLGLD